MEQKNKKHFTAPALSAKKLQAQQILCSSTAEATVTLRSMGGWDRTFDGQN